MKPKINKKKVGKLKVQGEADCPVGYIRDSTGVCRPAILPPPPLTDNES